MTADWARLDPALLARGSQPYHQRDQGHQPGRLRHHLQAAGYDRVGIEVTVRTRYAPSPTGSLHIGNVRSGLFAYLFARHNGGTFILRIDDTDQERSTKESLEEIVAEPAMARYRMGRRTARPALFPVQSLRSLSRGGAQAAARGQGLSMLLHGRGAGGEAPQAEREHRKPGYDGTCRDKPFPPDLPAARPRRRTQLHDPLSRRRTRARPSSKTWSRGIRSFENSRTGRPDHLPLRRRADLQLRHRD